MKSRHLTTDMIAYSNSTDTHKAYLPGGGVNMSADWQTGHYTWSRIGLWNIGGYERRIPKAFTKVTGIA
jgi:hypothetical protein